jgi:ribosome-binding factor A
MQEGRHRTERVADLIRQELAQLIQLEVKDPRVGFVTITRLTLTRDLRIARVFVTAPGDPSQQKESLLGLAAAQGYLRRELAHRLRLRHAPVLEFRLDELTESEERIDELLRQIRHKA